MTFAGVALAAMALPAEVKPMAHEGIPEPGRLGARPTTYRPCPNNPPRMGSKRRRQWR